MSGGKPAGYGGRMAGQAPNPYRGIVRTAGSDLVIEDGSTLLFGGVAAYPHIAREGSPTTGIALISGGVDVMAGGAVIQRNNSLGVDIRSPLTLKPSTTQTIATAAGSILPNAATVDISPAAAFTSTATPLIAPGTDAQHLYIRNVSGFTFTFSDETTFPGSGLALQSFTNKFLTPNDIMLFIFSTSRNVWVQKTPAMDT